MLENNALNRAPGKKDAARATGDIFRIQKLDFEKHKYYTRLRQVLLFYSFFCTTGLSQQEKTTAKRPKWYTNPVYRSKQK